MTRDIAGWLVVSLYLNILWSLAHPAPISVEDLQEMMISNVLRLSPGSNFTFDCPLTCNYNYRWCFFDGNTSEFVDLPLPDKYAESVNVFTKPNLTELHFREVTSDMNASLVYCVYGPHSDDTKCNQFQSGYRHIYAVVIQDELPKSE